MAGTMGRTAGAYFHWATNLNAEDNARVEKLRKHLSNLSKYRLVKRALLELADRELGGK